MGESVEAFYDDLAESYHLMFENWDRSIARQAAILGPILERYTGKVSAYVLDCACGIGTQAIGLAQRGHRLVGSDLSKSAIARAIREAQARDLDIGFHVADMRNLSSIPENGFDAVLVGDNALPHLLSQPDLERATVEIAARLKDSGILLATLRDYDHLLFTRPYDAGACVLRARWKKPVCSSGLAMAWGAIRTPCLYNSGNGERLEGEAFRFDVSCPSTIRLEPGPTGGRLHQYSLAGTGHHRVLSTHRRCP